jgi:hypothetical protein
VNPLEVVRDCNESVARLLVENVQRRERLRAMAERLDAIRADVALMRAWQDRTEGGTEMTSEQSLIDRLRCTIPTEASQQSRLTFQQRAMLDAAAEIERLRAAGDALADGIRTGRWDNTLDAWEEARRG